MMQSLSTRGYSNCHCGRLALKTKYCASLQNSRSRVVKPNKRGNGENTVLKATMSSPIGSGLSMEPSTIDVLLIGVTGGTGRSILKGMSVAGLDLSRARALTTDSNSFRAAQLKHQGLELVEGDLDDVESLKKALQGMRGVYCHALSKDAAKADPLEVERGGRLVEAAVACGVEHLVYNGAGGYGSGCPMSQMIQKHQIQDMFSQALPSTTTLQATLFMEELWKPYTRPAILKGKFPFAVGGASKVQLVAVRDMGLAAATALMKPDAFKGRAVEIAGDELTVDEICAAFARVQGTPVAHQYMWWMKQLSRFLIPDLYYYSCFLESPGYKADLPTCRELFPQMLSLEEFLRHTHWDDPALTYEGGVQYFTD